MTQHTLSSPSVHVSYRVHSAVPVERPQDVSKICQGFVNFIYENNIWYAKGKGGTNFIKFFKIGDLISISSGKYKGYGGRYTLLLSTPS